MTEDFPQRLNQMFKGATFRIGKRSIMVSDFNPYRKSIALFVDTGPAEHSVVAYFRSERQAKMFIQAMSGKRESAQ